MDIYIDKMIRCPISGQIYFNPVVAEDGTTYEKFEILKWFKNNDNIVSPITGQNIGNTLIPNYSIKSLVSEYLIINKDKLHDQYYIMEPFLKNKSKITI